MQGGYGGGAPGGYGAPAGFGGPGGAHPGQQQQWPGQWPAGQQPGQPQPQPQQWNQGAPVGGHGGFGGQPTGGGPRCAIWAAIGEGAAAFRARGGQLRGLDPAPMRDLLVRQSGRMWWSHMPGPKCGPHMPGYEECQHCM